METMRPYRFGVLAVMAIAAASNWLMSQRTRRFFARPEQKEALHRAQKVFNSYQDRPLWFVLKCFDLTEKDLS